MLERCAGAARGDALRVAALPIWRSGDRGGGTCRHSKSVESDDARMKALNYILEAWEEGTGSGIAPEMMAYAAALHGARPTSSRRSGRIPSSSLVNGLVPRVQKGEFTVYRSRQ